MRLERSCAKMAPKKSQFPDRQRLMDIVADNLTSFLAGKPVTRPQLRSVAPFPTKGMFSHVFAFQSCWGERCSNMSEAVGERFTSNFDGEDGKCTCILLEESIKHEPVLILPFLGLCHVISWTYYISRCTDDPTILILTIFPAKIGVTKKPLIFKQAKFLEPVLCGAKRYKMAKRSFGQDLAQIARCFCFGFLASIRFLFRNGPYQYRWF